MTKVTHRAQALSDGSLVHDVLVVQDGARLEFHCIGESCAEEFMQRFTRLIDDCTVDLVVEGWEVMS